MHFLVNRRTDYAVRVILGLARYPAGTRVSAQQLSEEMLIPLPMLYSLLKELARAQLIRTYPGAGGGVELAHDPADITLWDVVVSVDRPPQVSECVDHPGSCPFAPSCPVRRRWARIQRLIQEELEQVTFAELLQEAQASMFPVPSESPAEDTHPLD